MIAPLDQTNACRAGLWNPSTSSLTRGPWVPGAALHLTSSPLTCGARAREIDGLVVRVKVTIDLIAPLDQRMHAVQGYGILLLVA
jgi:hypothetical protein